MYRLAISMVGSAADAEDVLQETFAGEYKGWRPGQYVYEEVDSPKQRLAINNYDFSHPDFFIGHKNTPWKRSVATGPFKPV